LAATLTGLNPNQKTAVHYTSGPLLVLAGAGSGKTSVLTHKIAVLIRDAGFAPTQIAAVTFTNKAAREMKTRLTTLLGGEVVRGLTVSTFHSLGLLILRQHLPEAGRRPGFSIYDADDSAALVAKLMRASRNGAAPKPEAVHWQISRWKNALVTPDSALATAAADTIEPLAARVFSEYEDHLRAYNAFDFDDLIVKPVRLFQQHPAILAHWRERIRYLLVDEYQDTNGCQYELVRLLTALSGALTVVGDDDQSIYAWRGAQSENLKQLQQDFPALKVIKLEQNYRSSGRILKAANALIANNPHLYQKALWSERDYGAPLRVLRTRGEEHEAERVVAELQYHKFKHDTEFRDYAILYRENHLSRVFERVLRERRIPYFLSGGTSFFERTEVRDIMAYLRLLTNPDDDSAFLRVVNTPRREIGPATLENLGQHAASLGVSLLAASFDPGIETRLSARQVTVLRAFTHMLQDLVERAATEEPVKVVCDMLADLHYEDWLRETCNDQKIAQRRMENVLDLINWLQKIARDQGEGATLGDLVARLSLIGMLDRDGDADTADHVSLMTLHAAKGLEFPHVFIIGMEERVLPHHACQDEVAVQEERRLAYVGMTRAQTTLTFSLTERRRRSGEVVACEPSRFLAELPPDDLNWEEREAAPDPQAMQGRADDHLKNLRNMLGSR
jgi:ATP-dependent DNA helicase Rep